jgi:O-antigen/teichoic acid export membrane protein
VLNVGSMLAFRCDALVIGRFIDPAAVTSFDNGNKFFEPLTGLVLGIGVVVMPTATKLRTAGRLEELRPIFLKWSKVSLSIVLAVSLYLLVLGPEFLGWWIAPEYEALSGPVLQILALSFIVFLPVRGVALPILMGLGRPARPALALLVMGALNVALSIALVGPLGIEGVALGTAIPNVLFAGAVLWLACRELGVPVSEYVLYVAGRASVGALAPLGVGLALEYGIGIEGFVPLVASGILMVAVFALVWVLFVFRGDPHIDLRAMLARRAAREAP